MVSPLQEPPIGCPSTMLPPVKSTSAAATRQGPSWEPPRGLRGAATVLPLEMLYGGINPTTMPPPQSWTRDDTQPPREPRVQG
jgi:hypothetical protein